MNEVASKSTASRWPAWLARPVVAIVTGMCVGTASGAIQQTGFAPVGILSLAVGTLLGLVLVGAGGVLNLPRPRWGGIALAVAAAVVSQHLWLYRAAMIAREKATRSQPAVELFKPGWTQESILQYFYSQASVTTVSLWLLDACLLGLATAIIVNWSSHRSAQRASAHG